MKKYMLLMIMALVMAACKGTKTVASANKENNARSMVNSDEIEASGAMDNAPMSTTTSSALVDTDLKKMYKNLQMTAEQIQTFEKSIRDFKESVKYHPNGEMLGTVGDEQERQLKEILSEDQWNKYQVWSNNRAE